MEVGVFLKAKVRRNGDVICGLGLLVDLGVVHSIEHGKVIIAIYCLV